MFADQTYIVFSESFTYIIVNKIYEGKLSNLFLCEYAEMKKKKNVIVKEFHEDNRFDEGKILESINHPFVISAHLLSKWF